MDQSELMQSAEAEERSEVTAMADQTARADGGAAPCEDGDTDGALRAEAEGLVAVYPHFNLTAELEHPVLGPLLRGEAKPTLRQLYEAVHWEDITEERITAAVETRLGAAVQTAVEEAVAEAVRACEERLLGHIRARGQRPAEVGMGGSGGIRMHPAVSRLTRKERAMLAQRAENGETIKF